MSARRGRFRALGLAMLLALASTPAWMFVHHRLNPISATAIRAAASKAKALASKLG